MDATYTDIILDLYKPNYVEVIAKQYDARTRVVRVTVTDQEKVVTLGSTISAKLAFTKPDGKGVLADCTISNNKVNAVLKEGMLAAAGLTVADIILVEGSQILSTMKFGLRIERAALQDSTVVSSNEYSSLETALLQVEEWNTYFEQTSGQIETKYTERLNGMIPKANIANSRAVTEAGFTLDARQANKTIPGTMGYDIEQLNSSLQNEITDIMSYIGYTDADIYGVEVDFANKKFTRLAGAVNRTPGAAFDGISAFGGRKRCNVDNSGNVIAYYGDAGFSTTGKLTQAVTVGEGDAAVTYASGTIVQVMVEQPKFYYKVVPLLVEKKAKGSITRKVRYYVSDTAKAGFKLHPAFIVNGQENEKIYVSAFEGSLWDASASTYILDDSQVADFASDMLSSIANAKPMSGLTQNLARSNVRKLAEKRGTGWEQATVQTAAASELLMLIEYASFNMQSAIGQGVVNKTDDGSSNMAESTGVTITLGNASGTASNANGVQFVTYRGEENFWGNIWGWVDGLNQYFDAANKTSTIYIADHGFTDDTNATPYEDAGIIPSLTSGYVSAFCYSEDYDWLFIAGEVLGDSSLPVGDYFWNQNGTGWQVAMLGASWHSGLAAGAFCWNLYSVSSDRYRNVGGRLVYVPSNAA